MPEGDGISRDVPRATERIRSIVTALLNHLIGSNKKRERGAKAERRGSLQVDDHEVFQRQLHGKFRRLCATENVVNVAGTAVKYILELSSVGEQTTISGDNGCLVDRRNSVPRCQRYD